MFMADFIIAGNWKMHGSKTSVAHLLKSIKASYQDVKDVQFVVFPPAIFLEQVEQTLQGSDIAWGAQNLSEHSQGAFTGEISANMLLDFHCKYVLIGHSERRKLYGETNEGVAQKFVAAKQAGLIPVLCVGETLDQRQAGQTAALIREQIEAVLAKQGIELFQQAVIAYEPVWAIGTGQSASPEQAQAVHKAIREQLAQENQDIANQLPILYGGSVKRDNAQALFAMPDVNGALIGGASLDAAEFIEIGRLCNS
jgi:triosephosphate isomerase